MKKLLLILLSIALICCFAVGCGDKKVNDSGKESTNISDTSGDSDGDDSAPSQDEDESDTTSESREKITPISDGGSYNGGNYN